MWIYKDVLCTVIIAPLLPCDLAGTSSISWAIPSIRWPPLCSYSYHHYSNTCHQVVSHSHIHLMPFLGQEDHSVSPPLSPASCSPPATASWLALSMNWQSHFCLSSPACWHLGFWMERGIAAPCPWPGTIILSLWLWSQEQRWEACLLTHASTCPGNHLASMSHSLIYISHIWAEKNDRSVALPAFHPLAVLRMPLQQPLDLVNSPCLVLLL